jgi:hypothetical protein
MLLAGCFDISLLPPVIGSVITINMPAIAAARMVAMRELRIFASSETLGISQSRGRVTSSEKRLLLSVGSLTSGALHL